ncbi:hypothetical protein M3661_29605 [Paenibacillus sp. MER 180]|uniref:hypothetical protein n=1 Tax=Paenibacillus sp. MER 180 TaxID=2939570 RepID=UPI002041BCBB|nr:hypothetical protein [Paenibacillus sp. MER 180]MCM3294246.1 hypothetical protein [Paenibacillus sp. MER 180]
MPETRDWQEDWKMCEQAAPGPWEFKKEFHWEEGKITSPYGTLMDFGSYPDDYDQNCGQKPSEADTRFVTEAREALPYYMQELRDSTLAYAGLMCEYQSLKAMFLRMREECGAEKKRAAAAEERELKIKDVLEEIIYASTYSTDVTFEEIGKAKEICKSIYGELSYEKGNR